jgi:hypothetical protein
MALFMMLAAHSAMAQKTVALIRNDQAGDYATHDGNIVAILGTQGITIGATTIPGLGYNVVEYQAGTEPDPIDSSIADVIIISQTISSGNALNHTDDPVALINTEQALNDDNGTACDMYFSEGAAGRGGNYVFNITDNTHPITEVFPLGPIQMFSSGEMGVMTGALAGAITTLAVDDANQTDPCLAVAEAGSTPFLAGIAAGADPAPARRVCLGFHLGAMENPTVDGVTLFQRTVQWAIGDLDTLPVSSALRSFAQGSYVIGQPVTVRIDISHGADSNPLVVEETIPDGWIPFNISDGGTATGNVISWSIPFTADTRLTYQLWPLGGINKVGRFGGLTTDSSANTVPITGDFEIARAGVRPIIMIVGTAGGGPAFDGTLAAVWGVDGYTSPSPAIDVNGMGYPILQIGSNDPAEATSFTLSDGVMVFVSQTITSGDAAFHTLDPIPLIQNEQALFDDDPPPRNESYFSTGAGSRGAVGDPANPILTQMNILNNTHPITDIFPMGLVQTWRDVGNGPQMGVMTGTIQPNITTLAENPNVAGEFCLAIAEANQLFDNSTVPPGMQPYTTPARRANLGYHENTMVHPTQDGLFLAQRLAQWMIGEAVTAGEPAPAAPSNLAAAAAGSVGVRLTWNDNSDNENGFVAERMEEGTGLWIDVGQATYDVTNLTDVTADEGTTYTYRVRAFNVQGTSGYTNEVDFLLEPGLGSTNWNDYR